jgi:hypothetical protein
LPDFLNEVDEHAAEALGVSERAEKSGGIRAKFGLEKTIDNGGGSGEEIADIGFDETGEGDDGIGANEGTITGQRVAQMLGEGRSGSEQACGFNALGEGGAKEREGMAGLAAGGMKEKHLALLVWHQARIP